MIFPSQINTVFVLGFSILNNLALSNTKKLTFLVYFNGIKILCCPPKPALDAKWCPIN